MNKKSPLGRLWAEFRPSSFESIPGAGLKALTTDTLAGITVGIVAIPLALAFAIARHLIEKNRAWTLFSTHYFELTRLAQDYPVIEALLAAAENNDDN